MKAPTMVVLQFGESDEAHAFIDHWREVHTEKFPSGKVNQFVTFAPGENGSTIQVEHKDMEG